MGVVESHPKPGETEEEAERRYEAHWARVADNERQVRATREAYRKRLGYADND